MEAAGGTMTGMAPVDLSDPEAAKAWVEAAAALTGGSTWSTTTPRRRGSCRCRSCRWRTGSTRIRNELDLVFYVTKFAWPYLAERGGVIINTASISAYVATPDVGMASHCAAKGGVLALTRVFAADGAKHGIRAVSISPGPIKTPGAIKEYFHIPGAEEAVIGQLLTDRVGESEDIAALAAFVASDEAEFMTGVDVLMDGGMTAL